MFRSPGHQLGYGPGEDLTTIGMEMEAGDAESAGAGGGSGMEHALTHELAPGDPTPTSDWSEEQTVVWIERTLELSPEAVAQLRDECRREEFDGHSLVY